MTKEQILKRISVLEVELDETEGLMLTQANIQSEIEFLQEKLKTL